MREYYYNEGVYEVSSTDKREIHLAAQKYANRTGKKVRVSYRDLGGTRAVSRHKPKRGAFRRNPGTRRLTLQELKHEAKLLGYSVRKYEGEYRINKLGNPEATAYYTDDIQDAFDTMFADAKWHQQHAPRGYRRNPATYGGSVMHHRHAGILTSLKRYAKTLKKGVREAKRRVKGGAPRKRLSRPAPAPRASESVYTATLYYPDGRVAHTEVFPNKKLADDFAKSAKQNGFGAHVG